MEFGQHGQKKARAKSGESRPTLVLSLQTGLSSSGGRGFAGCLVLVTQGFVVHWAYETTFCPCETSVSRQSTTVWACETTLWPHETISRACEITSSPFELAFEPFEAFELNTMKTHRRDAEAAEGKKKTHHGEHGGARREEGLNHRGTKAQRRG